MKRITAIILILAIFLLMGCNSQQDDFTEPVSFYYPRTEPGYGQADSLIHPEIREGKNYDTVALLDLFLRGPEDPAIRNPFPAGTRLISLAFRDDILVITLTDEFAVLSGLDLHLACACIYATASELFDQHAVEIWAESELIDGKSSITVDGTTYLLQDVIVTPAPTGGTE